MAHLALAGGLPQRPECKQWPDWPVHGEDERALVDEVVRSGLWSIDGPKEPEFARKFAAYCGAKHGICVATGTAGMEIALRAMRLEPGDEVIVPALTFIAAGSSVIYGGGTVVFADIDSETYQLDSTRVEEAITEKTRAIFAVHQYARLVDMDAMEIARRHCLVEL